MMHLLAYTVASAGGLTNQAMPGVLDQFTSTDLNGNYIMQSDWYLKWAYANGVNLTNARINTPSLRSVNLPSIGVVDTAVTPTSLPGIDWLYGQLLLLRKIDPTIMEVTDTAGAGQLYGFLGLVDQPMWIVPQGSPITVRATASIVLGNKVWGAGSFALDQPLPAGRYAVIGMDVVGANLIAARLVPQGGGPRPGVIARTAFSNKPDPMFRNGQLGTWFEFESTAIPNIELFGNAAPTTQTIYLDIVRIR